MATEVSPALSSKGLLTSVVRGVVVHARFVEACCCFVQIYIFVERVTRVPDAIDTGAGSQSRDMFLHRLSLFV
ncbi:hypothetical protein FKP32DRAFT_101264 [Trametes sanguinea]|nr:hypothetical protein FKP32DRAFT_101264 [Trametes sanguinea]